MAIDIAQNEKKYQIKETFFTCYRLLGLVWQVDRVLLVTGIIATVVPAVIPFVNAYIYKLLIDLVIAIIKGTPFQTSQLFFFIFLRVW